MNRLDVPANVGIFVPTPQNLMGLRPTTVLDIFDGATTNLHPDGLFSPITFGVVGSDDRDRRFSYVNLNTEIFHPFLFQQIITLKGMYESIIAGKQYAIWSEKDKDLIPSDELEGRTGFQFFMENWKNIVYKQTSSDLRKLRIELMTKYKDKATTRHVMITPAGIRDIQIAEGGRYKQDEVNDFYRTLIATANTLTAAGRGDTTVLDTARYSLQKAFNNIYDYYFNILDGKGGYFQQKYGARRLYYGTRNVICPMDTSSPVLGSPRGPKYLHTVFGLYQVMKGIIPKTLHYLMRGLLSKVFNGKEGSANLVNKTTLKQEVVQLSSDLIDRWTSPTGLEKVVNSYEEIANRSKPVMIKDHYLALIYRGPDNTFKIFHDIRELPEDRSKDDVYPLTLVELLYLAGYNEWNKTPVYCTRYPVTGDGSIYPSYTYAKTTVVSLERQELGDDWQPLGENFIATEYPLLTGDIRYFDAMSVHTSRLAALGGDHDGDTMSANFCVTFEAIEEVKDFYNKAINYIHPNGGLLASPIVETVERVLVAMTGEPA